MRSLPIGMMSHCLGFLLLICLSLVLGDDLANEAKELSKFMEANGGSYFSIYYERNQELLALKVSKSLSNNTNFVRAKTLEDGGEAFRSQFNLVIVESLHGLNVTLSLMNNFTAKSFLIYFPPHSKWIWDLFPQIAEAHPHLDLLFYVAVHDMPFKWLYVMLLKAKVEPIIGNLEFLGKKNLWKF